MKAPDSQIAVTLYNLRDFCQTESDLDKTRRVILSLLESYPEVLSDPAPTVEVSRLSASSVDFIVRPWVANGDYWAVNWRFQREVYGALDREGISIPFNRLDVSLVKS